MKINKKLLTLGLASAVLAGGIGSAAAFGEGMRGDRANLTDDQKAQIESASGDREQMRTIMDSIREENQAQRETERAAVDAAIAANDYTAFRTAVSEKGPLSNITEEQFPLVVEMHTLQKRMDEIRAELGVEMPRKGMRMNHAEEEGFRGGMRGGRQQAQVSASDQ